MDTTTPIFYEASSAPSSVESGLARHERLLHFACKRFVRARPDLAEDILAVGRTALAEALLNYRSEMGFTFTTYAHHQMQWSVSRFLGQFTRKDFATASLDEAIAEDEGEEFTLADVADHQAAARERSETIAEENLLSRIHNLREAIATCGTLTAGEREILRAFLESGNSGTVASGLRLTSQRVNQALASAAGKLRKHLHAVRS
jgi:RNA polymerase sigma factor (sigma-70 family)